MIDYGKYKVAGNMTLSNPIYIDNQIESIDVTFKRWTEHSGDFKTVNATIKRQFIVDHMNNLNDKWNELVAEAAKVKQLRDDMQEFIDDALAVPMST